MKKIIISAVLAVFMALCISAAFTDVPEDAYYADAAERMAERGILSGFGDNRYYGDWELTRAQFAALACKMLGKADEAAALAGETAFADVPATHWSTGYVNYAVANKIINGDGDGNFRPDDSVKYEEAIKVIICVINPNNNITIDPTDWSKNYIEEANKLGLTENLIGKKGEFMKRSDIAVIADKGMTILDETAAAEEGNDPGEKPSSGKPSTPASTTGKKPAVTSEKVTTEATTTETTTVETTTYEELPPPPPGRYEGPEF